MFGFRPDGRRIKKMDPIVRMTPHIMPQRSDAQVFLHQDLDFERMARYVADQSSKGHKITFMQIIIAAYVRAISQHPEVNRFISNKNVYARKELTTSFTLLRDTKDGRIEETATKIHFDPADTIYDVQKRVQKLIDYNKNEEEDTAILKLVNILTKVPLLPNIVVGFIRILDRYGIMPKFLIDILPFHTGMFITNMASIGMHSVYHHIYNFGTTSMFLSMGMIEKKLALNNEGKVIRRRYLPIGITADERVCAGAVYAQLFATMLKHINNPELMEVPPENVYYDEGNEYHMPKPE